MFSERDTRMNVPGDRIYRPGKATLYAGETAAEVVTRQVNPLGLEVEELRDQIDQILARMYLQQEFDGD